MGVRRYKLTDLFGRVKQNGVAVKNANVVIHNGWRISIWVDRLEGIRVLLAFARINWNGFLGFARLLQVQRDLQWIW